MTEYKFVRDSSGAIINTDTNALRDYKKRKALQNQKDKKIQSLEDRIKTLETMFEMILNKG